MSDSNKEAKWVKCPVCRQNTNVKIFPSTVAINLPIYCESCDREYCVTIMNDEMVVHERKVPTTQYGD